MVTPVTIGVVARERFSTAARSLRRLLETTPRPFRLVIVDAGTPPRYRQEMERAAAGHPDVEFLRTPDYLNSGSSRITVGPFLQSESRDEGTRPRS